MRIKFEVVHDIAPKKASLGTAAVKGAFGLLTEQGRKTFVKPFAIDVKPGEIVAFVGTSGSGKSSCLRQFADQTRALMLDPRTIERSRTHAGEKVLVDQLRQHKVDAKGAMELLSRFGLAEARVFLRNPRELSDGQFYRYALADSAAWVIESQGKKNPYSMKYGALAVDEFCSNLDRVTAKTVSSGLRKWVNESKVPVAVATAHEDLLEDLQADHVVRFDGVTAEVSHQVPVKKKPASGPSWSLDGAPRRTGPGSRRGTTGASRLELPEALSYLKQTAKPSGSSSSRYRRLLQAREIKPSQERAGRRG